MDPKFPPVITSFDPNLQSALKHAQASLHQDGKLGWVIDYPTEPDIFLLKFVNSVCKQCSSSLIEVTGADDSRLTTILENVSVLTILYQNVAKKLQCETLYYEVLPGNLKRNEHAEGYFSWIGAVQHRFFQFRELFSKDILNYDEVIAYKESIKLFKNVAENVQAGELILTDQEIEHYKVNFQLQLSHLDSLLIKKAPNDSGGVKW